MAKHKAKSKNKAEPLEVTWLERALVTGPYVTLVLNEKQYAAAMNDCKIPKAEHGDWILNDHSNATMHSLDSPTGGICCIVAVRLEKDTDPNAVIGILVHESVHIWQKFKHYIGETDPSYEFEAYSIQNIAQGLIERMGVMTKGRNWFKDTKADSKKGSK